MGTHSEEGFVGKTMGIEEMKEKLIGIVLERSFKYSDNPPFTLVSGLKSNYYFNSIRRG
jgi:hypothetical protein